MMIRALWSGASGMRAQQFNIDNIAHDLTNVNTNGYKKTYVNFSDLFYQRVRAAGVQGVNGVNIPVGLQVGNGVRATGTTKIFTIGSAQETGIPTHMMIRDDGNHARNFFQVTTRDGVTAYTRDGSFLKDSEGQLVTTTGAVLDAGFTIPDDAQNITVSPQGYISYSQDGEQQAPVGPVQLHTFANPAGLEPIGDNLFRESDTSGAATAGNPGEAGFGELMGGWVEVSNVDAITEMVNMISAQRAYEFNSRSIQTSDEMLQTVNTLKR